MKTIVEVSMVAGLCLCDALVANGSRCCKSAFGFIGKAMKGNLASFPLKTHNPVGTQGAILTFLSFSQAGIESAAKGSTGFVVLTGW